MKRRFTTKQSKALPLLASGLTGVATAAIVGVKASTVSEWLNHNPDFAQELERLRDQVTNEAMATFQGTLAIAVREVQCLMTESKTDTVRLKAATFVIEHCGLPASQPDGTLDPNSRAELEIVRAVLNGLGLNHAAKE